MSIRRLAAKNIAIAIFIMIFTLGIAKKAIDHSIRLAKKDTDTGVLNHLPAMNYSKQPLRASETRNGLHGVGSENQLNLSSLSAFSRRVCITARPEFKAALAKQNDGVPRLILGHRKRSIGSEQVEYTVSWENFAVHFERIWRDVRENIRFLQFPSDNEEIKYLVEFVDAAHLECNMITLGVGFTTETEKSIQRYYPQCNFIGIDTEEENRPVYEAMPGAKFIAGGVSARGGDKDGHFLQRNGTAQFKRVHHMSIEEFFSKYNSAQLIDLLLMDVDGAEYELLEAIADQADKLPTICQINVELHRAPDGLTYNNFRTTYEAFFVTMEKLFTRFAIVQSSYFAKASFIRALLVNYADPKCIRKFLC